MTDSAIWLTCRDCGDTTRVLALMANRVLKTRTNCPACHSKSEPCLNRTPVGEGIALSPEQSIAFREMDDKAVRIWLEQRAYGAHSHRTAMQWIQDTGSRLADRFSKRGLAHGAPFAAVHEARSQTGTTAKHGNNGFHDTGTIGGTGSAAIRL